MLVSAGKWLFMLVSAGKWLLCNLGAVGTVSSRSTLIYVPGRQSSEIIVGVLLVSENH
jgi:hypothetical protein